MVWLEMVAVAVLAWILRDLIDYQDKHHDYAGHPPFDRWKRDEK